MARPSTAAAALLLLALSLLAVVAHCRPIEAEPAEESNAVVVPVSDEDGAEHPGLPADAGASVVQPADEQEQHGGFLRLPSQGHRRPCRHGSLRHRRHGWVRHQIFSGDAPRRFRSRHGEEERLAAVLPAEESEEEVKAVAEPDPDRSLPDSDGKGELASTVVPSFGDADGDEGAAAVRAWKKEMLRRWVHLHSQSHHDGMRHHHRLHHGDQAAEDEVAVAGEELRRFHHRRHHDEEEDEEKEKTMRKRFRPAAEQHDEDSDDEEEEVEEMVRRFRKAVTRRARFGHGHRFHHRRQGEEAAEKAEGGEESGVMTWIKGLMNRF